MSPAPAPLVVAMLRMPEDISTRLEPPVAVWHRRRLPPLIIVKLPLLVIWNTAVLPDGGWSRKPSAVVSTQPSAITVPLVSVKKRLGWQLPLVKRTVPPKPKVASG